MFARVAALLATAAERYVPSAFAIAVLLTFVTFAAAAVLTGAGAPAIVVAWGRGFWTLSPFAMQMSLVVLTGYLVAAAPPTDRLLAALGDMASNLIQPFWALPLLAAGRLGFRDILGHALLAFFVISALVSAAFWFLPRLM